MQSSLSGALRALVMLACLIICPLIALPDVSFPDWIKKVSNGRWNCGWGAVPKTGGDSQVSQAKPVPQRSAKASSSLFGSLPASLGQSGAEWPSTPMAGGANGTSTPSQFTPPASAALPSGLKGGPFSSGIQLALASEPSSEPQRGDLPRPSGEMLSRSQGIIPTAFVEQAPDRQGPVAGGPSEAAGASPARQDMTTRPAMLSTPAQEAPQVAPSQLARFRRVETRLRELGAVHYLLETWGNAADYYRFRCRMPMGGSSTAVRHFEATDSDGLAAMTRVLEEIEAWKASRPL